MLNVNLRAGTIKPFQAVTFEGGGFTTYNYGANIAGQAGSPRDPGDSGSASDSVARKFGYLVDFSGRSTDNALQPPQPDALGLRVFAAGPGATTQTTYVHRSGHYDALFAQDTWRATRRLTLDYGLRYDNYQQTEVTTEAGQASLSQSVSKNFLSPRVNLAYGLTPRTIGRLSGSRLFIQPPLAQGGRVGAITNPETYDNYNGSLERQVGANQTAKVAYYYKNERNEIDTNLLIPGTQIGAFSSVNFDKGAAHGLEFSYDLRPVRPTGFGAYTAYAYSIDKPEGLINTGSPVPKYNDHDVRHSLSLGADYTFANGVSSGLTGYDSSGTNSSVLAAFYGPGVLDNGHRQGRTEVNFRLASPKYVRQRLNLAFEVQNLVDSRHAYNFNRGFTGTRFQQGRRGFLSLNGQY